MAFLKLRTGRIKRREYGKYRWRIDVVRRVLDDAGAPAFPEEWDRDNPVARVFAQLLSAAGSRPAYDQTVHSQTQRVYRIRFREDLSVHHAVVDQYGVIRDILAIEEVGYRDRLDLVVEGTDVSS